LKPTEFLAPFFFFLLVRMMFSLDEDSSSLLEEDDDDDDDDDESSKTLLPFLFLSFFNSSIIDSLGDLGVDDLDDLPPFFPYDPKGCTFSPNVTTSLSSIVCSQRSMKLWLI
jgi:hypothetical protein